MWETTLKTATLNCSKTFHLQVICKTPHPLVEAYFAVSVLTHWCRLLGCERSYQHCPTAVLGRKSFRLTAATLECFLETLTSLPATGNCEHQHVDQDVDHLAANIPDSSLVTHL